MPEPTEYTKNLQDALRACCEMVWEYGEIDGGFFQEMMEKRGLLVRVPADEAFKAAWDADEMLLPVWETDQEPPHA